MNPNVVYIKVNLIFKINYLSFILVENSILFENENNDMAQPKGNN